MAPLSLLATDGCCASLDGWTTSTLQRMMGHCVIWWARRIIQMEEPGDAFGTFL